MQGLRGVSPNLGPREPSAPVASVGALRIHTRREAELKRSRSCSSCYLAGTKTHVVFHFMCSTLPYCHAAATPAAHLTP